jgi:TATA-box binding protein (TBP) (component of TFIID and TFIIIB)
MSSKPVSILVDPKLNIDDVRIALKHSSLEIEPTSFPSLFVLKPTEATPSNPTRGPLRRVG